MRSNPFWGPDTKKGVLGPPVRLLSGPRCRSFLFRGKIPAPSIPCVFFRSCPHLISHAVTDDAPSRIGLHWIRVFPTRLLLPPLTPNSFSGLLSPTWLSSCLPLVTFSTGSSKCLSSYALLFFREKGWGTGRGIVIQSRMGYNLRR